MEDHYEALYLLSRLPEGVSERGIRKLFQKKHDIYISHYESIPDHRAAIAAFETSRDSRELAQDACVLRNQPVQLNLLCIEITSFSVHGSVIQRVGAEWLQQLAEEQFLTAHRQDGGFHVSGCWPAVQEFRRAVRTAVGSLCAHSAAGEGQELPHDSLSSLIGQASQGRGRQEAGAGLKEMRAGLKETGAGLAASLELSPRRPTSDPSASAYPSLLLPDGRSGGLSRTTAVTATTRVHTGSVAMASREVPPPRPRSHSQDRLPAGDSASARVVPVGQGERPPLPSTSTGTSAAAMTELQFPSRSRSSSLPLSPPTSSTFTAARLDPAVYPPSLVGGGGPAPSYQHPALSITSSAGHSDIDVSRGIAGPAPGHAHSTSQGTSPHVDTIEDLDRGTLFLMKKIGVCRMPGIEVRCEAGSVTLTAGSKPGLETMMDTFLLGYSDLNPPLLREIPYSSLDDPDVVRSQAAECDRMYKATVIWLDRAAGVVRLASKQESELDRAYQQLHARLTAHQVERGGFSAALDRGRAGGLYGTPGISAGGGEGLGLGLGPGFGGLSGSAVTTAARPLSSTRPASSSSRVPTTSPGLAFTVDSITLQPALQPPLQGDQKNILQGDRDNIFLAAGKASERPDGTSSSAGGPPPLAPVTAEEGGHGSLVYGRGGARSLHKDPPPANEDMMALLSDGRVTLRLRQGSLALEEADVLVSPAPSDLQLQRGLAAELDRASEGRLQLLCAEHLRSQGPLGAGHVAMTRGGGGRLSCQYVCHAVGPIAGHHDREETDRLLRSVCTEALRLAEQSQARSIAFPALSAEGAAEVEPVARILLKTLMEYPFLPSSTLREVRVVVQPPTTFNHYLAYFKRKRAHMAKKKRSISLDRGPAPSRSGSAGGTKSPSEVRLKPSLGTARDRDLRVQTAPHWK